MRLGNLAVDGRGLAFSACFVAIGGFGCLYGLSTLTIGSQTGLGPGFFPVVISAVIAVLAGMVGVGALGRTSEKQVYAPLRGIVLAVGSPIVFALTIRSLGLVMAIALSVLVGALASRKISPLQAGMLVISVTAICVVLFHYVLRMPLPLLGTAFR